MTLAAFSKLVNLVSASHVSKKDRIKPENIVTAYKIYEDKYCVGFTTNVAFVFLSERKLVPLGKAGFIKKIELASDSADNYQEVFDECSDEASVIIYLDSDDKSVITKIGEQFFSKDSLSNASDLLINASEVLAIVEMPVPHGQDTLNYITGLMDNNAE